ncbi:hypothetical protein HAX54_016639 [Datura stramonium]|uniref:Uncharacterized protein n=1 Tax=Datura stramonium TaxID=4076 RepID=A0ABS8UJ98_DATST|nr:hypothetical protein [Datura stramonium]
MLPCIKSVTLALLAESDTFAAMDAAIEDGVDVISISIDDISRSFWEDSIALCSFTAIQNGILVSTTTGNTGPEHGTVANGAPWLLTVCASTTDRKLRTTILLENGEEIDGESAFQPDELLSNTAVGGGSWGFGVKSLYEQHFEREPLRLRVHSRTLL